ncbi:MAG: hypothetical protein CSB32_02080 [Desulfobacterales bacterium]|nr:MAG: hypothetical protein CSB32_02080 [Desulfobacterales bacterium]
MTGGKADIVRFLGFIQHSRPHARIVVVFGRCDDVNPVLFVNEPAQIDYGHHVGMAGANQKELFTHEPPSICGVNGLGQGVA